MHDARHECLSAKVMNHQFPENYFDNKGNRLTILQIDHEGVSFRYFGNDGIQSEYFCEWNNIEQIQVEDNTLHIYGVPTWRKHYNSQTVDRPWLWGNKGLKHRQAIPLTDEKCSEMVAAEIEKYRKIADA